MKRNILKFWAALTLSAILFSSCENNGAEDSGISSSMETTAKDANEADVAAEEALDFSEIGATVAMEGGRIAGRQHPRLPECAVVTVNREAKTAEINFGASCVCPDGKTRAGKIKIAFTGTGDSISIDRGRNITFESYSVNGHTVTGNISISERKSRTTMTKECTIEIESLSITFKDGGVHTTALATHTRLWKFADGTITDTGNAAGTTREGNAFAFSITTPIVRKKACFESGVPHPVSGVRQLEVISKPTLKIDFGTGECDNKATVYAGDNSKEITLGK